MKKILIAGYHDRTTNYTDALERLGAHPIVSVELTAASCADALLLPGGGDIDPALFGAQDTAARNMDTALDKAQFALLDCFVRERKPVLGICKGMQLINIHFGGGLIQDLPTASLHAYAGKDQIHPTRAQLCSTICRLYGGSFTVNSAHHQGIGAPGKDLRTVQTAPDGVAEAIEHRFLPLLAVQWHPERMCFSHRRTDTADGKELLSYFLSLI